MVNVDQEDVKIYWVTDIEREWHDQLKYHGCVSLPHYDEVSYPDWKIALLAETKWSEVESKGGRSRLWDYPKR